MQRDPVNFKPVGSNCAVEIRVTSRSRTGRQVIIGDRRRRPPVGLVVSSEVPFSVGALVEIDLRYPQAEAMYRSKGTVSWVEARENASQYRIGVLVFEMEKIDSADPNPMVAPSSGTVSSASADSSTAATMASNQDNAVENGASFDNQPDVQGGENVDPGLAKTQFHAAKPVQELVEQAGRRTGSAGHSVVDGNALADLLTNLMGEKVKVDQSLQALDASKYALVGKYLNEDDMLGVAFAVDVELSNWFGAALAMIPAPAAKKDATGGTISDETLENVQEIFNIGVSLFNQNETKDYSFGGIAVVGRDEVDEDLQIVLDAQENRVDYRISIPGYGEGGICFMVPTGVAGSDDTPEAARNDSREDLSGSDGRSEQGEAFVETADGDGDDGDQAQGKLALQSGEVSELFTGIIGQKVTVSPAPGPLTEDDRGLVGEYLVNKNEVAVACATDVGLANWLGAAMAMIPFPEAQKDVDSGVINEEMKENVEEMLKFASSLFNREGAPRHKMNAVYVIGTDELPETLREVVDSPSARADFEVEVPGYGSGILCFLA